MFSLILDLYGAFDSSFSEWSKAFVLTSQVSLQYLEWCKKMSQFEPKQLSPYFARDNTFNTLLYHSKTQMFYIVLYNAELQKFGILVSRIPDTSGMKSGHLQIIAGNRTEFGLNRLQKC